MAPGLMPTINRQLIEQSLEIAATRSDDLAPMVYDRLFTRQPGQKEFFCLDTDGSARGNMLFHATRVLLDLLGEDTFGRSFLIAESITHANMGVEPIHFASLYEDIRDVVRDLCQSDWSPEMERSWDALIEQIQKLVSTTPA